MSWLPRAWLTRGSRALLFVAALATTSVLRAQDLSRVQLEWLGPERCAVAGDVLARARASVDPSWSSAEAMTVTARVRGARDGGLEVSFEARRSADTVRRTLEVRSCEEARRATALLIALSLEEVVRDEPAETAGPPPPLAALEPKPAVRQAANEPAGLAQTSVAQTSDEAESKPSAEPEVARASEAPAEEELNAEPERAPHEPRRGPLIVTAAAGLDAPVLETVAAVLSASAGLRFRALELDLGASYWIPVAQELNTVHASVHQLGASLTASYWLSFGRVEIAPSARLLLVRLGGTLNAHRAEPRAWLRAAPGARFGVWLSRWLALQLSVEAQVSLTRPSLTTSHGDAAETPRLGFGAQAGFMGAL